MKKKYFPVIPWVWAWRCLVLAFPWSNAFMSIAAIFLGLTSISQEKLKEGSRPNPAHRAMEHAGWALILLVSLSLVSVIWGGNGTTALQDVRVKLPLVLGGGIMIGMARQAIGFSSREVQSVLRLAVFSAALATASMVVLDVLDGVPNGGRSSSRFISHIRFGLWWALLLPWVAHYLGGKWNAVCLIGALITWSWTQSLTGLAMGVFLSPWWLPAVRLRLLGHSAATLSWPSAGALYRRSLWMLSLPLLAALLLFWSLPTALPDETALPERSKGGEPYMHKLDRSVTENGHLVWTCVAWGELRASWRKRSTVPMERIEGALLRFLTSKALPKDAEGIAALSDGEVEAIGSGVSSVVELNGGPWAKRWNRFKFNWGQWWDGRRSPNASILARGVYAQMAIEAWKGLPWHQKVLGAGSGSVKQQMGFAFDRSYPEWPIEGRKRPHNQYLTFLLSLGVLGLGLLLWTFWSAWTYPQARPGVLLLAISCLTEDTLETQAGVTLAVMALVFGVLIALRGEDH